MKYYFYIILTGFFFITCRPEEDKISTDFPGKPKTPESLLAEHRALLSVVDSVTSFKDSTGIVAVKLKELMHHHFNEEEDYVLPLLGFLPELSKGNIPAEREQAIHLSEKLKAQYNHMIAEHQLITAFLEELVRAAEKDKHPGIPAFRNAVHKHASAEEEIYFPAAILVGEYLKLKTK